MKKRPTSLEHGELAAEILIALVKGKAKATLGTRLVVRASCGAKR